MKLLRIVAHRCTCSRRPVSLFASFFAFHATGNLNSTRRVFEFCVPVEVSMDVLVSFSSSSGSEAVSSLLSVPNDDSGMFLVMPIALFISEAVRATGSLLLSFASGDTSLCFETQVAFVVGSRAVDRAQWDLSRGRTIPAREVTLDPELAHIKMCFHRVSIANECEELIPELSPAWTSPWRSTFVELLDTL